MKGKVLVLMLSFVSLTLVGQTKAELRKQKRADKKE